jgi:hypothetical protein
MDHKINKPATSFPDLSEFPRQKSDENFAKFIHSFRLRQRTRTLDATKEF